jgi:CubicO group peptidase (beta-lactamase class C family)
MEHDATWILDREGADGMEMAGCCLNAALRDWARLGQLMLEDGLWRGSRILPRGWVAEATVPDSPQLAFGRADPPSTSGYQYQWWARPDGSFAAEGVYGQFIYVSPAPDVVIAKASVWPEAWDFALEREAFAAFEAIAAALHAPGSGG